ncbi:hypothetical protein B0H11DRAFT_1913351 [Mycena galericulata]|nr:hypothetical protein B0H11DRAFT_1913351 [Mycena galericulata]
MWEEMTLLGHSGYKRRERRQLDGRVRVQGLQERQRRQDLSVPARSVVRLHLRIVFVRHLLCSGDLALGVGERGRRGVGDNRLAAQPRDGARAVLVVALSLLLLAPNRGPPSIPIPTLHTCPPGLDAASTPSARKVRSSSPSLLADAVLLLDATAPTFAQGAGLAAAALRAALASRVSLRIPPRIRTNAKSMARRSGLEYATHNIERARLHHATPTRLAAADADVDNALKARLNLVSGGEMGEEGRKRLRGKEDAKAPRTRWRPSKEKRDDSGVTD